MGRWLQIFLAHRRTGRGPMRMPRSLNERIGAVFASIVLALGVLLSWLGYSTAKQHQHEVLQRISMSLAKQIATQIQLTGTSVADPAKTDALLGQAMTFNPNIEIYLLNSEG